MRSLTRAWTTNKIGLSNNTIGDHIKRIIVILGDAKRLGINVGFSFGSTESGVWV